MQNGKKFIEESKVKGMQLSISVKGRMVLSEGFGLSDIENGAVVTKNTRFRLGSVTKGLTSAALIKLLAEEKLNLDIPIQNYVPSYPNQGFTITTRHLAGHLGGNWDLVGAVIEGAVHKKYLKYMYEDIWKPLGMLATYGDVEDSTMSDKSKFYNGSGEEVNPNDLNHRYPSEGLISTTEDLVKFVNELLHGSYLNQNLKQELFKVQYPDEKGNLQYGLGWNIGKDINGHIIYYTDDQLDKNACLIIYPDDDIVIAYLSNTQTDHSFEIQRIGEYFYSK